MLQDRFERFDTRQVVSGVPMAQAEAIIRRHCAIHRDRRPFMAEGQVNRDVELSLFQHFIEQMLPVPEAKNGES